MFSAFEKGRIARLKATFRRYVKMEGTKDRAHPFLQLTHCVTIPVHPSSPPLIFTSVKTSEKHRHDQALLAMPVFISYDRFWPIQPVNTGTRFSTLQ